MQAVPAHAVVQAPGVGLDRPHSLPERRELAVGLVRVVGLAIRHVTGRVGVGAAHRAVHVQLPDATVFVVRHVDGLAHAVVVEVAERRAVVG